MFTVNQYVKVLEKNGHTATIARNGNDCLKKYENSMKTESDSSSEHPFDVVILDNNMPERNGVEVAKTILDKNPEQRIIFASAYDIDSLLKASESIKGRVEILQKPFSLSTMISKLENK